LNGVACNSGGTTNTPPIVSLTSPTSGCANATVPDRIHPAHAAMLFSTRGVAVLRKAAFQVFRLSDVNQLVCLVVNKVDAGRDWKGLQKLGAEFPLETFHCHGPW